MRILIVTSDYLPNISGVATLTYQQAIGLHKLGHDVTVLTTTPDTAKEQLPPSIPVHRVAVSKGLIWRLSVLERILRRMALQWQPDIVWCTTYRGFSLPVLIACRKLRIPYGIYFHGTELLTENRMIRRQLLKTIARRAQLVATNSNNSAGLLNNLFSITADVITPGVTPSPSISPSVVEKIRTGWLLQSGLSVPSSEAFIFICACRISRQKGIDIAIEAIATLPANLKSKVLYVIIGDGPDRTALQKVAAQSDIKRQVLFIGPLKSQQLQIHLAAANVYLQPSLPSGNFLESFGISYLEAQAAGLPCIATSFGGIGEAIKDGQTGLLVEIGSIKTLSTALRKIMEDTSYYQKASAAARAWSLQNTWEAHITKLVSKFESLGPGR